MKHVTWPAAAVFVALVAALAVIFTNADATMRAQVLGYFDGIVPFVLGFGAGAAAGGAAGYASGYLKGGGAARKAQQKAPVPSAPEPDAIRRAAEVVRVAADEGHLSADQARAAAEALRIAAEEARAVADLQRSLLLETRRTISAARTPLGGSPQG